MRETRPSLETSAKLVELVYELLDAHDDTARLAQRFAHETGLGREHELAREIDRTTHSEWAAHLDYLVQLQRVGREFLAAQTHAADA